MTDKPTDRTISKWKLADLKQHPRQAELFSDLPQPQFAELVEDMRANGQRTPIDILPDGTIICGHQRTRAAMFLRWDEIDVYVRRDLAELGEAAVEQRLIEDNLHRRHLDPLELARCYQHLAAQTRQLPQDLLRSYHRGDLRDVIAKRLDCSGRTLDRYLRVLQTPIEVQNAFSHKELSLVDAAL